MSFFGMGPMELLVIVTIAFILFGPEKMTEIMGGLGRAVREFRAMTSDLTGEFERTLNEVKETAGELQSATREALTVEGLNPFEQPASPAAIASQEAGDAAALPRPGDPPTVVPAAVRPTRSQGPAPTKADPLADFAVFGEPAPVSAPSAAMTAPESAPTAVAATEPVAEAEVLAPVESSNGVELVAPNGHQPEASPNGTHLSAEPPADRAPAAEPSTPTEPETAAADGATKPAQVA